MGVRKLDRDRYAAVVYGDPKRAFYQDGVFFSAVGEAVDDRSGVTVEPAPPDEPPTMVESAPSAADKLNDMHITKIKRLAEQVNAQVGVPLPKGGVGAKSRLVKYILDHTE